MTVFVYVRLDIVADLRYSYSLCRGVGIPWLDPEKPDESKPGEAPFDMRYSVLGLAKRVPFETDEGLEMAPAGQSRWLLNWKPCPCGYFGDPKRECRCSPLQIQRYRSKISGPLLDRIDIQVEVPSVRYQDLASLERGESSTAIRERVAVARGRQTERFKSARKTHCNAGMRPRELQKYCRLPPAAQEQIKTAITELNFSARAYDRILKVARTIADLSGSDEIAEDHVYEAIQFRTLDRQRWA